MVFLRAFIDNKDASDESRLLSSIRYNVTQILESEAPLMVLDKDLTEAKNSLLCFGIEDIQSLNYQVGKNVFCARIRTLINQFEKRIENVEVTLVSDSNSENSIRFIVAGDLINGQEFQFNSLLNVSDFSVEMESEIV